MKPHDPADLEAAVESALARDREKEVHELRSRFIDKASQAERWLVERIRICNPSEKLPQLAGQKLEAFRSFAAKSPDACFRKPAKGFELLNELQQLFDLRSRLCHGTIGSHSCGGDILIIVEAADRDPLRPWRSRLALRGQELKAACARMAAVINELGMLTPH